MLSEKEIIIKNKIIEIENSENYFSDEELLVKLGELYHSIGDMPMALNRFNAALKLNPDNKKAMTHIIIINSVFDFFNPDQVNP